eukprot:m.117897 g.117897  ORF g.117897 m.117897 type:complete len:71 (+) comp14265_c0_seq1:158-370(+)
MYIVGVLTMFVGIYLVTKRLAAVEKLADDPENDETSDETKNEVDIENENENEYKDKSEESLQEVVQMTAI